MNARSALQSRQCAAAHGPRGEHGPCGKHGPRPREVYSRRHRRFSTSHFRCLAMRATTRPESFSRLQAMRLLLPDRRTALRTGCKKIKTCWLPRKKDSPETSHEGLQLCWFPFEEDGPRPAECAADTTAARPSSFSVASQCGLLPDPSISTSGENAFLL